MRRPVIPTGRAYRCRTGRFGRVVFSPDQVTPASTERHTPAAFATVISSWFEGETARSESDAPRIDAPLKAVRLVQFAPPSSDRKAFRAKLYIRAPISRARAPGSGLLATCPSTAGGGAAGESGTGFQVSKSVVWKVLPECVRA